MDKNTSEDLTLTLKLKKSKSSIIFIFLIALSTKDSGQGSLYFSKISFSRDPALTPILIAVSLFFAAKIISFIFFFYRLYYQGLFLNILLLLLQIQWLFYSDNVYQQL